MDSTSQRYIYTDGGSSFLQPLPHERRGRLAQWTASNETHRLRGRVVRHPLETRGSSLAFPCLVGFVGWLVGWLVCWLVGCLLACLSSQQHASVFLGRICANNFTCCHTEIEVVDQTFYHIQSQYTYIGPTSPSADPITPGVWQSSHWSANC